MTTDTTLKKVRLSVSNAVHSLTVLVASEEGLFVEQGLDVELVKTAGAAQVDTTKEDVRTAIFERPLESLYNAGGMDQFRLCKRCGYNITGNPSGKCPECGYVL
ncbi:MAG: hypothetical protein IIC27_05410 [Chloroflexi bacterium]|nr:hypothetical protein [Chloroflexota bacterium]